MPASILIIEDNPANMELMSYMLGAFGYAVTAAQDGAAGIDAAQRNLPDLILCDVHLPKMDGYEIVRHLKGNPVLNQIPVIAVTALAMVGDREKLLQAGFNGYIGKPIEPEAFVGQVEKYLPVILHQKKLAAIHPEGTLATRPSAAPHTTILAVDDTPVNRDLLRSTLEPFGYRLLAAGSVQEAWKCAEQEAFDMILCDLHMPGQDGFEFIRAVRADPRFARKPFLFLSATSSSHAEAQLAMELGATRFLLRPIEPEHLIRELELCWQAYSKE